MGGWIYPHSVALAGDGTAWINGHFTHAPEVIARVDTSVADSARAVTRFELPSHPALGRGPGGPIPYEIRVAPDGRVWTSELQGNRLIAFDPVKRTSDVFTMPDAWSGPRRFDIDRRGILWIPAYTTNELVRLDAATRRFTRFPLPEPNAVPYVVKVDDAAGRIWIGSSASDAIYAYEPAANRFTTYPLPSRGALVRHLAIDPQSSVRPRHVRGQTRFVSFERPRKAIHRGGRGGRRGPLRHPSKTKGRTDPPDRTDRFGGRDAGCQQL